MVRALASVALLIVLKVATAQVPVVMLSDLHFDPLQDPAKAARLNAAPITQWDQILSEPASPTQAADYAAVQAKCGEPGADDASYALLTAAIKAAHLQSPSAKFVTVSGDLVVHNFECRRRFVLHTDEGYAGFVEKTTNFVIHRLTADFAQIPVYVALGNNDTSCGDYRMDTGDRYFRATSAAVVEGLRGADNAGSNAERNAERTAARQDYERGGFFSAILPGLHKTRLLAVDDLFFSRKYKTCAGKTSEAEGTAVLDWLKTQLEAAKQHGESVWFLAHIPTGVDVYGTVREKVGVCDGGKPDYYLASDALARLLEQYGGTVKLAVFGHTHADELRLIGSIPAKSVAAVTTIRTNAPSFTVAQVDPKTAVMTDFAVYTAKDKTGAGPWQREYDFDDTYKVGTYSTASLTSLVQSFRADPSSSTPASQAYESHFYANAPTPLGLVWPQYACSLGEYTGEAYQRCVCATQP